MRNRTHLGKILPQLDLDEDFKDEPLGRSGIFKGDVIRNLSQVCESGLGLDGD